MLSSYLHWLRTLPSIFFRIHHSSCHPVRHWQRHYIAQRKNVLVFSFFFFSLFHLFLLHSLHPPLIFALFFFSLISFLLSCFIFIHYSLPTFIFSLQYSFTPSILYFSPFLMLLYVLFFHILLPLFINFCLVASFPLPPGFSPAQLLCQGLKEATDSINIT
jgi:hypothetical protein